MLKKLSLIALLVALCATSASATVWNALNDFSATINPNGQWTYGYGYGPQDYRGTFDFAMGTDTDGGWTRSMGGTPDCSPYMWVNKTATAGTYPAYSVNLSSGTGGDDYHTYVRWTAPVAGWYEVDSVFQMMQYSDMSYWTGEMDVSVVVNGSVAYTAMISGADYKSSFDQWPPYDPGPKTFTGWYELAAGSTVDFVAGIGMVNASNDFANIAGCQVSTAVPEPSSILALMCGVAGMAGYIRRKKA